MSLKFSWLLIVVLAMSLNCSNLIGYYKCRKDAGKIQGLVAQGALQAVASGQFGGVMGGLQGAGESQCARQTYPSLVVVLPSPLIRRPPHPCHCCPCLSLCSPCSLCSNLPLASVVIPPPNHHLSACPVKSPFELGVSDLVDANR